MRLSWAILAILLEACSPTPRVIARESSEPSGSAGDSGSAGETGNPLPMARGPRGRVRVENGELRTDVGSLLRGVVLPVDVGWQLESLDLPSQIATRAGINTLHIYLENVDVPTGEKLGEADALVALSREAGLYVVVGLGGGSKNGTFNPVKVQSFWELYGPRYANETHVLYELQNIPELTCDQPLKAATLTMEQETYAYLRSVAPDTHVVMFSGKDVVQPAVLSDLIARLGAFADFSNASIAMHGTSDCVALADFDSVLSVARGAGVPLLISELHLPDWDAWIGALEQRHVSWLHHRYIGGGQLDELIAEVTRLGVTWCPDFGTFPQDSSGCTRP